ncbi:hypothetical protein C5L14_08810 [Labrys okinawensis]|uniref:Rap1a immunity protein domain-containing protein n=2 Tax=Labrys okinawensis TaxID=346911 RepID=A0A2S9QF65_9HYPH|nr:hypothetical protein C5L14_08810 [Labrys okinawensis]
MEANVRMTMAAFLAGALCLGSLPIPPALATEKPPADKAALAGKPPAPAKPHAPVSQAVDYGDMRCGFAVRRRDILDSQIIAWAGGYIEGYAKANPGHFGSGRSLADLTDPVALRTHLRGYCLKHRDKSLETAVLAMVPRPHGGDKPAAPAQHPAPQ